jgi:hypothetical protein
MFLCILKYSTYVNVHVTLWACSKMRHLSFCAIFREEITLRNFRISLQENLAPV